MRTFKGPRAVVAIAVSAFALGCSPSGGMSAQDSSSPAESATVAKVTAHQIKTAVTSPTVKVPVGHWAKVHRSAGDEAGTAQTYLVRVAGVVQGRSGELKNVGLMGENRRPSLTTAVPYYIAVQVAVVKGNPVIAEGPGLETAVDKADDAHIAMLQNASQDEQHCRPAPSGSEAGNAARVINGIATTCVIAVADPGAQYAPTLLQVGMAEDATGDPAATMRLPTAKPAG